MMKKYKEFKNAIDGINSWKAYCNHQLMKAIESNNEKAKDAWAGNYVRAIEEKNIIFGSNIKYAVIYKLTHKGA